MTRVNLIPVEELSDQNLIAEYHELPRILRVSINNAPERYCLGKGHMKWAKLHLHYACKRYADLCFEMEYRGFKINYPADKFIIYALHNYGNDFCWRGYIPSDDDIALSRNRIIERYHSKHRWTKRNKPSYLEEINNGDTLP